jgi:hypothetical protein
VAGSVIPLSPMVRPLLPFGLFAPCGLCVIPPAPDTVSSVHGVLPLTAIAVRCRRRGHGFDYTIQVPITTAITVAITATGGGSIMKYLLMMHAPRGTGNYEIFSWPPEDFKAHMEYLARLNRELVEEGEWVDVLGLTPPGEARLVRAGENGEPVTDGPFPETKEFLAGFWVVDVATPERAWEIAAKASTAPGPGGAPLHMPIEVREVMSGAPTAEG